MQTEDKPSLNIVTNLLRKRLSMPNYDNIQDIVRENFETKVIEKEKELLTSRHSKPGAEKDCKRFFQRKNIKFCSIHHDALGRRKSQLEKQYNEELEINKQIEQLYETKKTIERRFLMTEVNAAINRDISHEKIKQECENTADETKKIEEWEHVHTPKLKPRKLKRNNDGLINNQIMLPAISLAKPDHTSIEALVSPTIKRANRIATMLKQMDTLAVEASEKEFSTKNHETMMPSQFLSPRIKPEVPSNFSSGEKPISTTSRRRSIKEIFRMSENKILS